MRDVWVVIFCIICVLFAGLGGYPLFDPDEGRYAEISREMLESGDFITPRLNYVPYFEKPPLMYWVTAGSLALFGEREWSVRLVPALAGVFGLAVAWWLAALLTTDRRTALWAAAVMGSSLMYLVFARLPIIDMLFTVLLAAALTAWYAGEKTPGRRHLLGALSGVFTGLAVLAKGPVGLVLFAAVTVLHLAFAKEARRIPDALWLPLGACFIVAAPWFLTVQHHNPEFNNYFFVNQHFQRFTGQDFDEHKEPFYFFFWVLAAGFIPWSLFWPSALARIRSLWRGLSPQHRADAVFLLVWTGVVVLFFSASSCKLMPYILPAWPPVAVLTALWLKRSLRTMTGTLHQRLGALCGALVPALVGTLVVLRAPHHDELVATDLQGLILPTAVLMGGSALLPAAWALRPRLHLLPHTVAAAALLFILGTLPTLHAVANQRNLATVLPASLQPPPEHEHWTIAQYRCYNQSLNFYTRSRVVLIDEVNELRLGVLAPDYAQWFLEGRHHIARLATDGPLVLVTRPDAAEEIAATYPLSVWRINRSRALLLNEAAHALVTSRDIR